MRRALVFVALCFATTAAADPVADLWLSKCRTCHGINGAADTKQGIKEKIDDMRRTAWQQKWTDKMMHNVIANGVVDTKMKAFSSKLSTTEIDLLIAHIRTFREATPVVVVPPPPAPVPPPTDVPVAPVRPRSDVVVFEGRKPAEPLPPADPSQPTPKAIRPILEKAGRAQAALPPAPEPVPAPAPVEEPKVAVPAPVEAVPPPAPQSQPTPYLAYAGIALSAVALFIALRRRR